MFCPNCGAETDSNFCPECGMDLRAVMQAAGAPSEPSYPPLCEPYRVVLGGREIDLHLLIRRWGGPGASWRMASASTYLQEEYQLTATQANQLLAPLYEFHKDEKVTIWQSGAAQTELEHQQKLEEKNDFKKLKASGRVYCPKCHSTDVTAQKKGFGVLRGAVGAALVPGVGLLAGGIGAKDVFCVCMKCGHKWKPGKK